MSVQVKPAGSWRIVTQPWVKVNDVQRTAVKTFNKIDGVWRESWPLQPGAPGAPITTTTYRNDRIEIDVSWTAPTSGEPVARYIVVVHSPGVYITTVEVAAPTTAMTLTNGGNGFHWAAGYGVFSQVYAQSAAGRNGVTVQGPTTTISQLPPPDPPTSYSVTMWQCSLSHSWSHAGGRRIDGTEIHVQFNGAGNSAWYNASTFSAGHQSWDPGSIGGGWVTCYCRTYGPGGVSSWRVVQGEMPNPVGVWAYRWGDGYLRAATSGISPAVQVHVTVYGGSWVHRADFPAGAGEVYDPESINYPRYNDFYGMILRPVNNANGWVGRDQWIGWAKKMPNPYYVSPIDSQTWRGWDWRPEQDQDWQGASQQGTNAAFFFYGNQFYDQLCASNIGYDVGIHSAQVLLWREWSGGFGQPVHPYLMVHRAAWIGEDINWGGHYPTNPLNRGEALWCEIPPDWIWLLKERAEGYKGLGLYHPNDQLLSYIGYVSAEYMIMKAWNNNHIEGHWIDSVRIWHNG